MNGVSLLPRASDAIALRKASLTMALSERDVLTREKTLKASVSGSSHTAYKYEIGPDGKRYIVGAEVSVMASEDELDAFPGIRTLKTSPEPLKDRDENEEKKDKTAPARDPNEADIARMKQTEREVMAHESAHKAVAGSFGGPVSYTYAAGPDGKRYITGGEVPIHTPATDDPEEALRNASQVMRAALAPGDPSGQDIAAAGNAAAVASDARARLASGDEDERRSVSGADTGKIERSYASHTSPRGLWSKGRGFEENPDRHDGESPGQEVFGTPVLDIAA